MFPSLFYCDLESTVTNLLLCLISKSFIMLLIDFKMERLSVQITVLFIVVRWIDMALVMTEALAANTEM